MEVPIPPPVNHPPIQRVTPIQRTLSHQWESPGVYISWQHHQYFVTEESSQEGDCDGEKKKMVSYKDFLQDSPGSTQWNPTLKVLGARVLRACVNCLITAWPPRDAVRTGLFSPTQIPSPLRRFLPETGPNEWFSRNSVLNMSKYQWTLL